MPAKAKVKLGQPTKKNPLAVKRILKIAKSGLPLHFVAQAGDITRETLNQWRKQDLDFDRLLRAARLEAVERRWNRIEKAAIGSEERPPAWQVDAWALERAYPQHFSRPETQLSVNQSVSTGPTNIVIVGPERAKILATRHAAIRATTEKLLQARQTGDTGNGQTAIDQTSVAGQPDQPNTEDLENTPELSDKSSSWWARFIFPGAPIPKADASEALRLILAHLKILADERVLDFKIDYVTEATFSKALEKLTDGDLGWRGMIEIYERVQARERMRADH